MLLLNLLRCSGCPFAQEPGSQIPCQPCCSTVFCGMNCLACVMGPYCSITCLPVHNAHLIACCCCSDGSFRQHPVTWATALRTTGCCLKGGQLALPCTWLTGGQISGPGGRCSSADAAPGWPVAAAPLSCPQLCHPGTAAASAGTAACTLAFISAKQTSGAFKLHRDGNLHQSP